MKGEPGGRSARRIGPGSAPRIDLMRSARGIVVLYCAAGVVMTAVAILLILLGHLLAAGVAALAVIAAFLSAAGRLAEIHGEDPDQ